MSYGLNLAFLLLTFLVFSKSVTKTKKSHWLISIAFLFLATPVLHYQPPDLTRHLLPFLSLFFLFLMTFRKPGRPWLVFLALFLIFLVNCYAAEILTFSPYFQRQKTILANHHISESIEKHRMDALNLLSTLRLLRFNKLGYVFYLISNSFYYQYLFNKLGYVFYLISNSFYYLSFLNINNAFLIVNLFPLTRGALKCLSGSKKNLKIFIFGSIIVTSVVMGFSRPVNEMAFFFLISPLLFYLIFLGLEEIDVRYYLPILLLNSYIQIAV